MRRFVILISILIAPIAAFAQGTPKFNTVTAGVDAANQVTIAGGAQGGAPGVTVSGVDANIDYNITTKGTGTLKVNGVAVPNPAAINITGGSISGADTSAANVTPPAGLPTILSTVTATANSATPKAQGLSAWFGYGENNFITGATAGETDRVIYTTKGPISQIQLFLPTQSASAGQEIPAYNPTFYLASVEYPLGANSNPPQFTLNGQSLMLVGTAGSGVLSDPVGITIPANTQYAIRYATFVAQPPASISAAGSTTGGTLSAATYFYKETCVVAGVESGPTAEASATTTGSTSSVALTAAATTNPIGCSDIKIYRATTTGAETYLARLSGPGLVYVDTGAIGTVSGATPPAAAKYSVGGVLASGWSSSAAACGGSATNNVVGTGSFGVSAANSCFIDLPMVVADDVTSSPVCGLGDSIQAGTGIQKAAVTLSGDLRAANWFTRSLPQGIYNVINMSLPSSEASTFVSTKFFGGALRQRSLEFCSSIVSDLGTNDIYGSSVTWQNLALAQIAIARAQYQKGKKYYITTLLPRGSTTDNMILEVNYTVGAEEAARISYNTWVRAGMQIANGAPVTSGGVPTPYIAGYFDIAQAIGETNANNIPTLNGGYWPVPGSAYGAGAVSTTTTGGNIPYGSWVGGDNSNFAMVGMVVKITSGADLGQTCIVTTGNSSSTIFCGSGVTGADLSVGDTFSVYQTQGFDGIHPSLLGHSLISSGNGAQGFAAWATANLTP